MNVFEIQADDGTVYEVEAESLEAAAKAVSGMGGGEKSWGQWLKENLLPDDDPTTHNMGETAAAAINKAGEAMTFGLIGDEADARLKSLIPGRGSYDEELARNRQQEEVLERDNPGLALTAEVGGALAAPLGAVGALGKGAGMLARTGASAATTGALSGAYGFLEGEGGFDSRLSDAKSDAQFGAAIGAAIPVAGAGVQKVANSLARNRGIREAVKGAPSADELTAEGRRLYQQVDDAGVQVRADAFDDARQGIVDMLRNETAYSPRPGGRTITPKTYAVVNDMAAMSDEMANAGDNVGLPFSEIDSLRRQAGAAAGNVAEKSDQQAGMKIIEGLDDFVNRIGPDDVVAGDIDALKTALPKARDTWSRMKKSQLIDDAIASQGNYLSGDASAIRNRVATILRSPKLSRGFNDAELAAMRKVVSGSIPQQMLNYLGSGLGLMGQMGVGGMIGGGWPGVLAGAATGAGARKAANALTERQAEVARALIASGKAAQVPTTANPAIGRITEQLLRQGTAALVQ